MPPRTKELPALTRPGQSDDTALDWRGGGVPVSRRFDDPYFSLNGGLAETRHVFLNGNDLPNARLVLQRSRPADLTIGDF